MVALDAQLHLNRTTQ